MKITICGSIKFMDQMQKLEKELTQLGHQVFMPTKAQGVDYWAERGQARDKRVKAKRDNNFIQQHFKYIKQTDAILVVNKTKNEIQNYVGANTFAEIIYAFYCDKKIFFLNQIPKQDYILDELDTVQPTVINGNLEKIK